MRLRSLGNVFVERDGAPPQMFSAGSEFEVDDELGEGFLKDQLAERLDPEQEPHALGDITAAEQPDAEKSGAVLDGQTVKAASGKASTTSAPAARKTVADDR